MALFSKFFKRPAAAQTNNPALDGKQALNQQESSHDGELSAAVPSSSQEQAPHSSKEHHNDAQAHVSSYEQVESYSGSDDELDEELEREFAARFEREQAEQAQREAEKEAKLRAAFAKEQEANDKGLEEDSTLNSEPHEEIVAKQDKEDAKELVDTHHEDDDEEEYDDALEREFAARFEREQAQEAARAAYLEKLAQEAREARAAQEQKQNNDAQAAAQALSEERASTQEAKSSSAVSDASAASEGINDGASSQDQSIKADKASNASAQSIEASKSSDSEDEQDSEINAEAATKEAAQQHRAARLKRAKAKQVKQRLASMKKAQRQKNKRLGFTRSLQFRITMVFAVVGFITTAFMCVMSYIKVVNTTQDFVDEELSQIASVAINYRMIIPRRWEAPRHNHERVLRLRQRNGELTLEYGSVDDGNATNAASKGNPQGRYSKNKSTDNVDGTMASGYVGKNVGSIVIETADGRKNIVIGNRPGGQYPNVGTVTTPNGAEVDDLTPSISDIHKFKYDIIIAPLFGRPGDALYIPPGVSDGFYTLLVADQRVRAFISTNANGQRFVVARPLSSVESIIKQALNSTIYLFIGINLLFIPLLMISVKLMFSTLNKIAKSLYKRSEDDLSSVVPDNIKGFVPSELDGFILALNKLFSKVDDGIQSKRRFIADAAHEMRTPLTALSLQAESLEKEELSPKARAKVERLKEGISRERELMTALLTLAREQNKTDLLLEQIDILDLYTKIIDEQGVIAERKNIDLGVEGNANHFLVCDLMHLGRIMGNLVSNAIKYTPDNGRIDLICNALDDGRLELIVQDNGPGIPEEHLKHILEPFYRVHGDRSEVTGTGLGLAIVKASCESLNATLKFSNATPHGLIAKVTIASLDRAQAVVQDNNRLLS